jgi:hypothetical protein
VVGDSVARTAGGSPDEELLGLLGPRDELCQASGSTNIRTSRHPRRLPGPGDKRKASTRASRQCCVSQGGPPVPLSDREAHPG